MLLTLQVRRAFNQALQKMLWHFVRHKAFDLMEIRTGGKAIKSYLKHSSGDLVQDSSRPYIL